MNRRTFLLALGAAACGPKAAPKPPRPPKKRDDDPVHQVGEALFADRSWAMVLRCPFAVRGDVVVRRKDHELWFLDANKLAKLGTAAVNAEAFCFLPDGKLAAYVQPYSSKKCEVHVVDEHREVKVYWGPEFVRSVDTEIVPGRSAQELFISDDNYDIVRFELRDDGEARATGRVKPDLKVWKRLRQLASLGDGRVVTHAEGALLVQEPGKPLVTLATPDENAWHVAHAGGKRVWYSYSLASRVNTVDGIALATIGDKLAVEARIGFAPETVAHMAASGGALAVLVAGSGKAAVIVFDATGKQRWRADVPAEFYAPDQFADGAWVAMSDHRVFVIKVSRDLLAFDAATGDRVS